MHTTAERAYNDNNMFGTDNCYTFLRMMVGHRKEVANVISCNLWQHMDPLAASWNFSALFPIDAMACMRS